MITGLLDLPVTLDLFYDPNKNFALFMEQSVFSGQMIGGSDFGVFLIIYSLVTWLYYRYKRSNNQMTSSNFLEKYRFIVVTGVLSTVLAVHSLKLLISRARPNLYFRELMNAPEYSHDYWLPGIEGIFGPKGYSWNSLPSGHSSTSAIFITMAYLLSSNSKSSKILPAFVFLSVLLYTMLMGVARSMSGMHWLSDSVASFFIVWTVTDAVWRKFRSNIVS
ncbi:MAG: phosphatase PAP2 family protein [Proteobacteria bacterium]|nr:phosphatase PAP2 family protein [Pseudomonadota bacterium]